MEKDKKIKLLDLTEALEKKDFVEILAILQFTVLELSEESPKFLGKLESQSAIFSSLDENIMKMSKGIDTKIEKIWGSLSLVSSSLDDFSLKVKQSSDIRIKIKDYESLISILECVALDIEKIKQDLVSTPKGASNSRNLADKTADPDILKILNNTVTLINLLSNGKEDQGEYLEMESIQDKKPTSLRESILKDNKTTLYALSAFSIFSFFCGVGVAFFLIATA